MKGNKRKKLLFGGGLIVLLCLAVYCYFENTRIETTEISIVDRKIPMEFDGYKIAHVSDLHNVRFGENNRKLLDEIVQSRPDAIFITGDLIDASKTDIGVAGAFVKEAMKIAPIYYVTGNHEAVTNEYMALSDTMKQLGVTILDNQCVALVRNGSKINIVGLADPEFVKEFGIETATIFGKYLAEMEMDRSNYTILLSHRPEPFDFYVQNEMDLVFCGHAHGGQFRVPFVGGIVAPNQGIFPEYTAGVYENGSTKMIVSRGLGNSIIPIRINNNPELVMVTLKSLRLQ